MNVIGIEASSNRRSGSEEFHAQILSVLPRLRRFCLSLAGREGGDDLCQSAVSKALSNEATFIPGTRLDSWLFRIARNQHIDNQRRIRTRGREDPLDAAETVAGEDGVRAAEGRSDLNRVLSAFELLPEEQRLVMTLVVVEGLSYKEAAESLDIPLGTVMSRLARARQALDRSLHGASAA